MIFTKNVGFEIIWPIEAKGGHRKCFVFSAATIGSAPEFQHILATNDKICHKLGHE
jgi:hypothetical protein